MHTNRHDPELGETNALPSESVGETDIQIDIEVEHTKLPDDKWRDLPFAILYYVSIAFSLICGSYLLSRGNLNDDDSDGDGEGDGESGGSDSIHFDLNVVPIIVGILAGICFTLFWLAVIVKFSKCMIKTALLIFPIAFIIMAIFFIAYSILVTIIFVVFAAISAYYAYAVWNRIEFAAACISIAVTVFRQFHHPIYVNFLMSFTSFVLLMIDLLVFVGTINSVRNSGTQLLIFFLLVVLIYWHNIVTINVAHVTSCGVMASWFFTKESAQHQSGVTSAALKRATTTSFGSICFGALIEAVIRGLAALANHLKERGRRNGNTGAFVLGCVLQCLLDLLGDIIEYINSYTFVYVAMYGDTYLQSAKNTYALFKSRGIQALINDDLTHIPFTVGGILCVLIVLLIATASGGWSFDGNVIIAIVFAIIFYACTVHTLISYIKTLFVCWMEDPYTFKQNRPQSFKQIMDASNHAGYDTSWC